MRHLTFKNKADFDRWHAKTMAQEEKDNPQKGTFPRVGFNNGKPAPNKQQTTAMYSYEKGASDYFVKNVEDRFVGTETTITETAAKAAGFMKETTL